MADKKRALIAIKVFAHQGLAAFKGVVTDLRKVYGIEKISPVFKARTVDEGMFSLRRNFQNEIAEGLVAAAILQVEDSPDELLRGLTAIEKIHQKEVARRTVSLNLLAYEQEIIMLPGLSLPHPELHLRPEELVPSSYVWPDYFHPVLKKTIREIVESERPTEWGEFYSQGETLIKESDSIS